MTPDISAIVEETIRLQRATGLLQLFNLAMILVSNVFIILCVINIRRTMKSLNKRSAILEEWGDRLRAERGDPTPKL